MLAARENKRNFLLIAQIREQFQFRAALKERRMQIARTQKILMQTQLKNSPNRFTVRRATPRISKAFTLVELLIVIAIISILAAILFPVFSRARENARRSSCASNLKQIGMGLLQYTQDYDEKLPFAGSDLGVMGSSQTPSGQPEDVGGFSPWQLSIQPYLNSRQVFQCASNSSDKKLAITVGFFDDALSASYLCNGSGSKSNPDDFGAGARRPMNRAPGGANTGDPFGPSGPYPASGGATLAELMTPSQTVLVSEEIGNNRNPDVGGVSEMNAANAPFQNHLGTSNYLLRRWPRQGAQTDGDHRGRHQPVDN